MTTGKTIFAAAAMLRITEIADYAQPITLGLSVSLLIKGETNGRRALHSIAKSFSSGVLKTKNLQYLLVFKKNLSYSESLLHNGH